MVTDKYAYINAAIYHYYSVCIDVCQATDAYSLFWPFFTKLKHRSHLDRGCKMYMHICLKCQLCDLKRIAVVMERFYVHIYIFKWDLCSNGMKEGQEVSSLILHGCVHDLKQIWIFKDLAAYPLEVHQADILDLLVWFWQVFFPFQWLLIVV